MVILQHAKIFAFKAYLGAAFSEKHAFSYGCSSSCFEDNEFFLSLGRLSAVAHSCNDGRSTYCKHSSFIRFCSDHVNDDFARWT